MEYKELMNAGSVTDYDKHRSKGKMAGGIRAENEMQGKLKHSSSQQ